MELIIVAVVMAVEAKMAASVSLVAVDKVPFASDPYCLLLLLLSSIFISPIILAANPCDLSLPDPEPQWRPQFRRLTFLSPHAANQGLADAVLQL